MFQRGHLKFFNVNKYFIDKNNKNKINNYIFCITLKNSVADIFAVDCFFLIKVYIKFEVFTNFTNSYRMVQIEIRLSSTKAYYAT